MVFIVCAEIIVYFVFIAWTWQSLGAIEKKKKVIFMLLGIMLIYGVTWLIFPKIEMSDPIRKEIQQKIQNTLVFIFTGINGIVLMPQIGRWLNKMMEDEMKKEKLIKKLLILLIIFVMCAIFERGYMADAQGGIFKAYDAMI